MSTHSTLFEVYQLMACHSVSSAVRSRFAGSISVVAVPLLLMSLVMTAFAVDARAAGVTLVEDGKAVAKLYVAQPLAAAELTPERR